MRPRRRARARAAGPLIVALAAAGLAAGPARAAGQMLVNHAALDPARPNVVQVVAGMQYGLVAGIGYTRAVALGGRTLLVSGSVSTPWAEADTRDYGGRVGAAIDILGRDRWRLLAGLGGTVQGTENALSRMTSLGADGVLIGGHWSPRWFIAAEAGYAGAIATRVTHTDYYREMYHADARDGWYVDTGSNIHAGVAGGVSFRRYDLVLRAGQARDREGHTQLIPAYLTLGLNVRL